MLESKFKEGFVWVSDLVYICVRVGIGTQSMCNAGFKSFTLLLVCGV